jgi:DNA-binding transcriptional regulator YdaS (Cro superfamily)
MTKGKPAHERFRAWVDSLDGDNQNKAAALCGTTQGYVSKIARGHVKHLGLPIMLGIERATRGAIRVADWARPAPQRRYKKASTATRKRAITDVKGDLRAERAS